VVKKKKAPQNGAQVVHLHVGDRESERESDDEEVEALDALEEGQLSRAMEEVRQVEGAKAEVYRVLPADRAGHCRVYAVSVFSHERVAADYGPGKYRVRFKGPGDKYIRGGGTFDIAEGLNPVTPPATSGVQDLLALIKSEREAEKAEREKKSGAMLEWAKLLVPTLGPAIIGLFTGGSKGPSIRDLVATMKDMKDLQAPQADLETQFTKVIGILQGAKELVGDDGGKATGSTWVDLIRDAIQSPAAGALVGALTSQAGRPSPALPLSSPGVGRQLPSPATAPQGSVPNSAAAPSTAPESSPDVPMLEKLAWLRQTVADLLVQAGKGSNPRLYAEVVLDNLPPFMQPKEMLERLSADAWLGQLQALNPGVTLHADWFTKFRNYAVRALERQARKESSAPDGEQGSETASPVSGINQPRPDVEEGAFE
jgi:hypothetical protein